MTKIIELNNNIGTSSAEEVAKHYGFKKVINKSPFPSREFFEKDGVQYSYAFPIWDLYNGRNKVRLIIDNSNE